MFDLELGLSIIAIKHGEKIFEDKEKLLELLRKEAIMHDEDLEFIQALYDSGIAQRIIDTPSNELSKELDLCYPILTEDYHFGPQPTQEMKAAVVLATFAGAVGFPKESIEAFVNKHNIKMSPLYGDQGVWSKEKGLELLPAWENYTNGCNFFNQGDKDKAIELWEKAGEEGVVDALMSLGALKLSQSEYQKAKDYYLKAVELGESSAMYILGKLEENILNNYTEAEKLYQMLAQENQELSLICLSKLKVKQDKTDELEKLWIESMGLENNGQTLYKLAVWYRNEYNNYEQPLQWLKKSYEAGFVRAASLLCGLYTLQEDYNQAEKWGLRAAKTDGDHKAEAMNILGILYMHHLKKPKEAAKWFRRAIKEGNYVGAMVNLGNLYQDMKEYKKAGKYFLKAARLENSEGMTRLADLYQIVFNDQRKALKWYHKAADLNNKRAMNNLAVMYMNHGCYKKAEKMLLKSVENGEPLAMYNLGLLYFDDLNNPQEAEKWLLKAANAGNFKAYNDLGILYEIEFGDYESAKAYYREALNHGISEASDNLQKLAQKLGEDSTEA